MHGDLKPGDSVMVVMKQYKPEVAGRPQAGAIGTISKYCFCIRAVLGVHAYGVQFDEEREYCYIRSDLKKIEPPADVTDEAQERERELV